LRHAFCQQPLAKARLVQPTPPTSDRTSDAGGCRKWLQLAHHAPEGVGAHAEAGEDGLRLAEQRAALVVHAALDAVPAEALEAERELRLVADLAEQRHAAAEEVL